MTMTSGEKLSVEELVQKMVGPLEDIHRRMEDKLSGGHRGRPHHLTCRPFILHRNQWNSLVLYYSKVVREIKADLMRTLEAPIATLQALHSAMKAAEISFEECVVPHIWQTNDVSFGESKDYWGWGSVGLPAASQDESAGNYSKMIWNRQHAQREMQEEKICLLMVGKLRSLPRILAQKLVGMYVEAGGGQYVYHDSARSLEVVIDVIHVKEFVEQKARPVDAVWYVLDALDHRVGDDSGVLELLVEGYWKKLLLVMTNNDSPESQDKKLDQLLGVPSQETRRQSFLRSSMIRNFKVDEAGMTELMDHTMSLMNRRVRSKCKGFCRAADHNYRLPRARHYHDDRDRPFLAYYYHACALHLSEEEKMYVRTWLVRDALKHVLSPEIPHQHMDHLLITSTAVKQTLSWQLHKALTTSQQLLPQRHMIDDLGMSICVQDYSRRKEEFMTLPSMDREDVASAKRFLDSQFMHEIDRHNSQFILRRLHRHHHNLSVDAREPPAEPAFVAAAQFGKCESRSSSSGRIAETDHSTIKSWSWISKTHHVAVKKGKSIIQPHEIDIQARVRHPNLLPLLCWTWKTDEVSGNQTRRLVMELMEQDLDRFIDDAWGSGSRPPQHQAASSPIPVHVCVDVMLQIAKGMEYLHSHNIMHRDLKLANVLIRTHSPPPHHLPYLRVKIADFGASKADFHTGSNPHSAKVGTAFYRAPEVMEEDGVYSKKADVYSSAMVCYRILTGETPFHSELEGDRVTQGILRLDIQNDGRRPSLGRLATTFGAFGAPLKDMVEQCWHREAHNRPEFGQIAEFLRFMKVCALQLPSRSRKGQGEGVVTHSRPDIAAVLETNDLLRTFCSHIS